MIENKNIHNIYKMTLFNKINKLIPKQLYSTSGHNVLALVFVLLVILVVQYPAIFSKSANTVFGKAVILLIVILLTNYNTLVGLAATIVALVFYVYLFDSGYEGFVTNMDNNPDTTTTTTTTSTGKSSTPSEVGATTNSLLGISTPPAIAAPTPTPVAQTTNTPELSQTDKMFSGQIQVTPQDSNTIPYTPVQNPNVQPTESTGNAKSTSDSNTLKPAPASVTAPTPVK
jgi:hypothetical protein